MQLFAGLTIKQKVFAGFGVMLVIISGVAISALLNLKVSKSEVVLIADEIQPAVLAASELQFHIERANSSLGFYLLSKEESHKKNYLNSLAKVDEVLKNLQNFPLILQQVELQNYVKNISADVEKFHQFRDRIFLYAENREVNVPGIKYAAVNLSPIAQQMLQQTSTMIQSESEELVSDQRRKLLLEIDELRYSWASVLNGLRAYLAFKSESALNDIKLYSENADKSRVRLTEMQDVLTLDQADSLEQFSQLQQKFYTHLQELIKIHSSEKWRLDSYMIRTELGPLVSEIGAQVTEMVNLLRNQVKESSSLLVKGVSDTIWIVTVLLGIGLLTGFAASLILSRAIVSPIVETQLAMEDIASGQGDLTKRLDDQGNDEIAHLAHAFNLFAGKVQNIVREVIAMTDSVANAAERLMAVTEETQSGADQQQQETGEVATAVNELAATSHEVARNTQAASDSAKVAHQAANHGYQVIGATLEAIKSLADEVQVASDVIDRVDQDSENIGSVLDVIKGIAEQTNLLALNAAIEAARAGEQGRGFAVVADEVRTLASRTQQSTAEIQNMINQLQTGTRNAVGVMEQSRNMADNTVSQASEAGASLNDITTSVSKINDINTQIAGAAEEQSQVAEEINVKVVRISQITDQTVAGAQQTTSASGELMQLSEKLRSIVGQFKI